MLSVPSTTSSRARCLVAGLLGVFVLSTGAVLLRPDGAVTALWWPAAPVSAALVLAMPRGGWRYGAILTVMLSGAAANLVGGRVWTIALAFGLSNAAEAAVVGTLLTRRDAVPALSTLTDVGRFFAACTAGAVVIGMTVGATVGLLLDQDPLGTATGVASAHGSAMLLLLPLMLGTAASRGEAGRAERLGQTAFLALLVLWTFGPSQDLPIALVPCVALVWAALRCGTRHALLQTAATGVMISGLTLQGWGPFSAAADTRRDAGVAVDLVQVFVLVFAVIVLAVAASVEDRRRALDEVKRLALHDTLTGAGNRRLLDERLGQAINRSTRGEPSSLLLLDLDGFKAVNDMDGHQQGDRALITVADRLQGLLRPCDTVARLGGDEFVVLLPGVSWDSSQARHVCERITEALGRPYEQVTQTLGVSIGGTAVRADVAVDVMLHEADREMYEMKARRKRAAVEVVPGQRLNGYPAHAVRS